MASFAFNATLKNTILLILKRKCLLYLETMKELFRFQDPNLLRMALTHRSYVHENPSVGEDNERLEFLGDAILNFLSG